MSELPAHRHAAAPGTGLHRVAGWLWNALVMLLVLLAIYLTVGRAAFGRVGDAREWLLSALNERLPFTVAVEQLGGAWSAFSPELRFEGLRLQQADGAPIQIAAGHVRLDVPATLVTGSLQLSRLELSGVSLRARLTEDGSLEVEGFSGGGGGELEAWLREFLPQVERLSLREHRLLLRSGEDEYSLRADLSLERAGNARLLQARLGTADLEIAVRADGVGNPLKPLSWAGDVFIDATSDDLQQLRGLWEGLDWPFRLRGAASAQFWLNRSDGDSRAQLRVRGGEVHIEERAGAWALPLDALSFSAALEQRAERWTLRTDALHVEREGRALDLARAQFDWRRSSLRIRAADLRLGSLPMLLASAPGIPEALRDSLQTLAPSGRLRAMELRFDDLTAPANTWSLRGSLDQVAVKSWRDAPALEGISGFLELAPSGGLLRLDSGAFSMHFPSVYREPLAYHSAKGDIALAWDSQGVRLKSGLLEVRGPEGRGLGRFALDLPFSPRVTGAEMDLLVSMDDSTLDYSDKYLPYRLPGPLLDWVGNSVEGGRLRRGVFIWRGSLRPRNYPHLSVQLFLDIAEGRLRYDPDWPAAVDIDGRLWVDNGKTWARVRSGRVLDTRLEDLSFSLRRRDGPYRLAVAADLKGDAADSAYLLKESPLATWTRGAFAGWRLSGPLSGRLALDLGLDRGAAPPIVDLRLDLDGVDADVSALALPLREAQGEFHYHSDRGFSGSQLTGSLWDAPLSVVARDAPAGAVDLQLTGSVDGAGLSDLPGLGLLEFMSGRSAVEGELRVERDGASRLILESDLMGTVLDAPRPFAKLESQSLPLRLELPLQTDPSMELALGERLKLRLDFESGSLARLAAAVGADARVAVDCDSRFCLEGTLSQLDLHQWRSFADRYLRLAQSEGEEGKASSFDTQTYRIDSLTVGDLRAGEWRMGAARLDLWGRGLLWQGALEASWAQGSLTRRDDRLWLLIESLDVKRLGANGDKSRDGSRKLELAALRRLLPSMRVDVLDLRRGDESLGGFGFDLDNRSEQDALIASGISGELFGVDLAPRQPGLLSWVRDGDEERSAVELDVEFTRLATVLENAGFAPTLEADRGSAAVRLRWPGSPLAYRTETARGALRLNLRDGQVLETRPGALALVSMLNLAEILRRLSLSHMFESGIPFQTASSDIRLHAGDIEIADLRIDGAASAFAFTGHSVIADGSIEGELVVTLPVADNLPWVAALAGGPAVAAGVFVVSKVFEKQFDRASSAVYGVSGSIDSPAVSFRRLFDDRPQTPPAPADEDSVDGEVLSKPGAAGA